MLADSTSSIQAYCSLSRVVLLAKLGLRGLSAVSAGWARFLCEILTHDFVPKGIFLCDFLYLCVCLGDPFPQPFIFFSFKMITGSVLRMVSYSSILHGNQTQFCCLSQPHPRAMPFSSFPITWEKKTKKTKTNPNLFHTKCPTNALTLRPPFLYSSSIVH